MITVKLSTYDLSDSQEAIIKKLLREQPGLTVEEYCVMLNISSRTFFRYQNRYEFEIIDRVKTRHPTKDRDAGIFTRYAPGVRKASIRLRIKSSIK